MKIITVSTKPILDRIKTNYEDIYNLEYLYRIKVVIEFERPTKIIVQYAYVVINTGIQKLLPPNIVICY